MHIEHLYLNDESGFLISAELVLVFSLVFCAVAVGISVVKDSLAAELHDVAEAIGAVNQSYVTTGLQAVAQGNDTRILAVLSIPMMNGCAFSCIHPR